MLKRTVKRVMRSLGLHGVILRNETTIATGTGYSTSSHFETIIAFEALGKDGNNLMERLVTDIKSLCFPSDSPPVNFTFIQESLATKPTISGIAIAETNVQSLNRRHNSSGKVYNLSNPSTVEKVFTKIKSGYKEYAVPAVNIINALSRNTSS